MTMLDLETAPYHQRQGALMSDVARRAFDAGDHTKAVFYQLASARQYRWAREAAGIDPRTYLD